MQLLSRSRVPFYFVLFFNIQNIITLISVTVWVPIFLFSRYLSVWSFPFTCHLSYLSSISFITYLSFSIFFLLFLNLSSSFSLFCLLCLFIIQLLPPSCLSLSPSIQFILYFPQAFSLPQASNLSNLYESSSPPSLFSLYHPYVISAPLYPPFTLTPLSPLCSLLSARNSTIYKATVGPLRP